MQLAAKDKNELKESAAKQMAPKPTKTRTQPRQNRTLTAAFMAGLIYGTHTHTHIRIYFNDAGPINYGAFT